MLRVSLDVGHERFHALFKHGPVGQGHGPQLGQEVRCVLLEFRLLQGALHRDHMLSHPGVPSQPIAQATPRSHPRATLGAKAI